MLKYLYYIRYFSFIAWNWNLQLAFFTIYHELIGEKKYDLDTARLHNLRGLTLKGENIKYAQIYQGASYFLLEDIFRKLASLHRGRHFVDMGCGKGRALVVAAHHGFTKVTGVDFAAELCQQAETNCRRTAHKLPGFQYRIVHADAVNHHFEPDADVIYFFNPFDQRVIQKVSENLLHSLRAHPRTVYVLYINPQFKPIFLNAGFSEVYHIKKIEYVEASILKKSP